MKNVKKLISLILSAVLMLSVFTVTSSAKSVKWNAKNAGWTSADEWYLWSQGAFEDSLERNYGCRTVAYAKMLAEAGFADFDNPEAFNDFIWENKLVTKGYAEKKVGRAVEKYTGGAMEYVGQVPLYKTTNGKAKYLSKKEANDIIMEKLNEGYYVCLSCSQHFAYVLREDSLNAGKALISDSWVSWAYNSAANKIAFTKYKLEKFKYVRYFKVNTDEEPTGDEEIFPEEGVYNIRTANSDFYLDYITDSDGKSDIVRLNSTGSEDAEAFYIKREASGWYTLKNVSTAKNLDVCGAKEDKGVMLQLYSPNQSKAQRFKFYKNSDGVYIKNQLGYYLDVPNGEFTDGTIIQTWTKNDTDTQRFYLEKASGYGMISYDVDEDLVIHSAKNYKDSSAIGTVREGEIVKILDVSGKFKYISYPGISGWCSGKYVINL